MGLFDKVAGTKPEAQDQIDPSAEPSAEAVDAVEDPSVR